MYKTALSYLLTLSVLGAATLFVSLTRSADEDQIPFSIPFEEENSETVDSEKDLKDELGLPTTTVAVDNTQFVLYGWNLTADSSSDTRYAAPKCTRAPPA